MGRGPNSVAIGAFVADIDSDADFRVTAKLTGWEDAAPVRSAIENRAQQDGGWDAPGQFGPRIITVDGVVDLPTHAEAMAVCDALTALRLNEVHEFIVDNEAVGARSAMVRVTQGAVLEWVNGECFTYTLQVTAPDPLKYGPATFAQVPLTASGSGTGRTWPRVWPTDWGVPAGVTPGAVSLANAGTAGYWPRVRIDGPVTNPVLTLNETGDTVRFNGSVAVGQWLDVECDRRRVTLNGVASRRFAVSASGNWLAVPPGGGSLSAAADSSGASTLVSVWGYEGAWQ